MRHAMPIALAIAAVWRFATPAAAAPAGPGVIIGEIRAQSSGLPLAAVEVVVRRAADSTVVAHATTTEDGRFRLDGLPLDRYLFRASALGYRPYSSADVALTASAPIADLGSLSLAVAPVPIPGVTTTTERATVIVAPDRNIYLTKDMPAATAGTATDVLRTVPELEVDMDGKVSLRGSSNVTIQLNGRPAPMRGDALTTFLRQFPANRIERVEVIANPSAKFDPEGTAGIVNIVLKDGADLGLSGSVALNAGNRSNGATGRLAYQRGKLTFFGGLSGNRNRSHSSFDDFRENLLARPLSFYRLNSTTDYRGGFAMTDASVEWALDKRSTLYGSFNGYLNSGDTDGASAYALLDSIEDVTRRYDRANDGGWDGRTGNLTLGFRHVVQADRNEWTAEVRQNGSENDNDTHALTHVLTPAGTPDERSLSSGATGNRDRAAQLDLAHPLGARGKVEAGYRGSDRRSTNHSALEYVPGDPLVTPPANDVSDYVHHEIFHSGYLTLGSTFGKLSAQLGARAEAANTTFDVTSTGARYDNDYRSLFPSANVAYDFGKGLTVRFAYSKRIERASAGYLNPDMPSLDTLNRWVGNPYLRPKYTHSFSLEGAWTGSRGSVRLSPYYRETVGNWDQFKQVDANGVAITTWRNAASVRLSGASLTLSLRQTGRLGGSAGFTGYRERHDASNLSSDYFNDSFRWSASVSPMVKATAALDLQGSVRFAPAQTLAQGRVSSLIFSNVGARLKLGAHAWANLWVNDPFNLWHYEYSTRDRTHAQTSSNRYSMRSAMLSLTWTFGKPPEQKPRRPAEEQPQQEPNVQMH